jgi:hypothetical protein
MLVRFGNLSKDLHPLMSHSYAGLPTGFGKGSYSSLNFVLAHGHWIKS